MRYLAPLALVALAATPALAHHGWGSYDADTLLRLEAPVAAVGYEYPHTEIEIVVEGKTWHVVLAPPSRMERRGIAANELVVGLAVIVEGYASTAEPDELRAERIILNGRTVELR